MRAELMLELSGLSRQEQLVVKACAAPSKSGAAITQLTFEAIAEVLIEQYASVHLGWSFENTFKGTPTKGKAKPKGTTTPFRKVGFLANEELESWDDADFTYEKDDQDVEYEYTGLWTEEEPQNEDPKDSYGEYVEDVTEYEAIALNATAETQFEGLNDSDERNIAEAIQLQQAAFVAFNRTKGKGKGKGKGQGKVVRSHLRIEQRRQKLSELKSRSKCFRCGAMGHWAGDPQCKFPGGTKPKDSGPPKPVAHYAISDSSGDDCPGIHLGAGKEKQAVASMALSPATPKMGGLAARMDEDEALKPPGSDTKMPAGSYRGKTYWTLLHRTDYYKNGIEKGYKSKVFLDFCDWVHEYFHVNEQ